MDRLPNCAASELDPFLPHAYDCRPGTILKTGVVELDIAVDELISKRDELKARLDLT